MKTSLALALALAAAQLHAHDGHGLAGGHWHATDASLWIALALAALALWWGRK
jgi:hypothetical protein